jgi:hypothetical protein
VIDDSLFITGAQRSGTTLLEKLLGRQEGISILSQPFPLLFVEAKREFLRSAGFGNDLYPLGHLFRDPVDDRLAFGRFLHDWRTSPEQLRTLFDRMAEYSGQYTKFSDVVLNDALSRISEELDFAAVVAGLDRLLAPKSGSQWFGSKETICEEFVPHLLERGFRCAIILRDPRDLIASLNHGRGGEFGGQIKPTLFNIRSWRKSVAFALALESHPGFGWCRYEDLVRSPGDVLTRLASSLGLGLGAVRLDGEIIDEAGDAWRGNSSHGERRGISTSSVGAHRGLMPPAAVQLIEAACLPEMQLLGYETSTTRSIASVILAELAEPYANVRSDMEEDLAKAENAAVECERLARVTEPSGADSSPWFLFRRTHTRLRESFRP